MNAETRKRNRKLLNAVLPLETEKKREEVGRSWKKLEEVGRSWKKREEERRREKKREEEGRMTSHEK